MNRSFIPLFFALLTAGVCSAAPAAKVSIPTENSQSSAPPDFAQVTEMAQRLIPAIEKNDPSAVLEDFFPRDIFNELKSIPKPDNYYNQLVEWYRADIKSEHERLKAKGALKFESVKKGSCKWKAAGSENNHFPYWSCTRTKIIVSAGEKREEIPLRVIINWGPKWYVTHLGPIPKGK